MKIVGFQSGHDVSYCILENGVPLVHEELERFIREKEPLGDGLKFFFDENPHINDISHFAFGNWGGRRGRWRSRCGIPAYENKMNKMLTKTGGQFFQLGHHQCHAASAYYSSNFSEALIITVDGGGWEGPRKATALTVWEGKDNKIKPIKIFDIKHLCIGAAWSRATKGVFGLSTGHPIGNQAGSVMAMATLGNPKYFDDFYKHKLDVNHKYYKGLAKTEQDKFDIAASLQKATEVIFRETIEPFIKSSSSENLCLSGGVSLNCVMMGKIKHWFPKIKNIYCDPVPYDGGLALGAARYAWHHLLDNPKLSDTGTPYLGRKYSREEVQNDIKKYQKELDVRKSSLKELVNLLDQQNIISVFGGGSESGRRALGNRSILADPRSPKMKDIINQRVKHRQWYRPFAPSILKEEVENWFEEDIESPYMSFAIKFKEFAKEKVPAVVHYDLTGRLQTVTKKDNKWYYDFLKKWQEKSGVPIILNTSFNDREPIVETPEHAIKCFLGTDIDYLYFYEHGYLLKKKS